MSPSDLPSPAIIAPALVMLILGAGIRAHQNSKERGSWTLGYTIFVWWLRVVVAIWVTGLGVLVYKSVWPPRRVRLQVKRLLFAFTFSAAD